MTFELRDYQQNAIDGLYDYWACGRGDNPLIIAPTGSGKTFIIAQIIKDAMSYPDTRVLLLTHVKELLEQDAAGLLKLYPEADFAFYSASMGQKMLNHPITFGGIQSIWNRACDMIPPPDLVLVDEAHLVPKKITTRYGKFLADLKLCNPQVKVVGLTATHYRLDSGLLHRGDGAIFDGIAYNIPVSMLMEQGYLSPVISKGGLRSIDLTNVHKRGGEFIDSELATAASDPELIRATVAEIVRLGHDRKSWLIFASGISHAYMLYDQFRAQGVDAQVVTGTMGMQERNTIINSFKSGALRCLINIDVLTNGFDAERIDLVALVRATMSAGLYVQMVGRGTRTFPGKTDCLVLDYGSNVERHGFIDAVEPSRKGGSAGEGQAPVKKCPECLTLNHAAVSVCVECGHQFPPPAFNHGSRAYEGALLSTQTQPEWADVTGVEYCRWSKQGKPDSVRVTYRIGLSVVHEWLCPDHGGYAAEKYRTRRRALGARANTTNEAVDECLAWVRPARIKVKKNGKYMEILQLDYRGGEHVEAKKRGEISSGGRRDMGDNIPF